MSGFPVSVQKRHEALNVGRPGWGKFRTFLMFREKQQPGSRHCYVKYQYYIGIVVFNLILGPSAMTVLSAMTTFLPTSTPVYFGTGTPDTCRPKRR